MEGKRSTGYLPYRKGFNEAPGQYYYKRREDRRAMAEAFSYYEKTKPKRRQTAKGGRKHLKKGYRKMLRGGWRQNLMRGSKMKCPEG